MVGVVVVAVAVTASGSKKEDQKILPSKPWTCYDWRVCANDILADEINRKEQDRNNYFTVLDYNFCKTVVSRLTKGRFQDQKSSGLGDQG